MQITRFRSLTKLVCVALYASLLLGGCATVRDVASRTPLISMFLDASDAYKLVDSIFKDDSMSEEAIRAMLVRPLPAPPGISFEVGLLRKAAAATALGEVEVVEDTYVLAMRSQVKGFMLDSIAELVVESNAWSGDLQKAKTLSLIFERKYIEDARDAGQPPFSWVGKHLMFYNTMLAIASGLGDRELYSRLMSEYPETLAALPKLDNKTKALYVLSRKSMPVKQLTEEGDYDAALMAAEQFEHAIQQWGELATDLDKKVMTGMSIATKRDLSVLASLMRKPAAARQHIRAMQLLIKESDSPKRDRVRVLDAEAMYLASIGRHDEALKKLEESWANTLRFQRIGKISGEGHARDKARLQVATGAYEQALATIEGMGPVKAISIKYYQESAIALKAYAKAALGRTQQDLSPLDGLDAEMVRRIGTENARFHFAVKAFAHYAAFKSTQSETSLRQAVQGGRLFSKAYRRMRSTGQFGDITSPPELYQKAKEAYLLAALTAIGKYGVTLDDILDAFTLFYDSETDEDISSAALRSNIPGLVEGEVRRLQDLRITARKTARHLEIVGKQGNASAIEKAASEMERATTQFENELKRLENKAPRLSQTLTARTPSLTKIRNQLLPTEALVAYAPTQDGTASLIVTKESVSLRKLPITALETKALVDRIRSTILIDDYSGKATHPYDIAAAADLHEKLLPWAAPSLKGINQLSVITKGSLASIPFGLLVTHVPTGGDYRDVPWLIKQYAVTHAPSLAAWTLAGMHAGGNARSGSFLAWADPDFGGTDITSTRSVRSVLRSGKVSIEKDEMTTQQGPIDLSLYLQPLRGAREEAEEIARIVHADPLNNIISGSRATRASVLARSQAGELDDISLIMFATHGLAPDDLPGLSQPALAMAKDPKGADLSLLLLDDVVGMHLSADWVLLSACNTSSADRAGGDSLSGLARGFFFAGAKSLLVTHWEVETDSAKAITVNTMKAYFGDVTMTRAQALQTASIGLINGNQTPTEWAHPAFWAPYALVGSGQR